MFRLFKKYALILLLISSGGVLSLADTQSGKDSIYNFGYYGKNYGFGKSATKKQIAGWNTDIRYDGHGAPDGEGSVEDGEGLYEAKCALCHGSFGEGEGRWPKLSGGEGTLTDQLTSRPEKTVGSYWPYVGTLMDYIYRAMPYNTPKSLSPNEAYAITAYVLSLNDIVDDDFVLNKKTIKSIVMPNAGNFIPDPRPDTQNTVCMKNCKKADEIKLMEHVKGVTPSDSSDIADLSSTAVTGESKAVLLSERGRAGGILYDGKCSVCHANGVGGAPKIGALERDRWNARISKGLNVLVDRAIKGYEGETGIMPAKGGFVDLSDNEIQNIVMYMLEASGLTPAQ